MKLAKPAPVVEGFVRLGYPESLALGIGIVELACAVIYVIPRTSVLGAILLTGYLGGATATHVRIGEPFFMPIILGVLVWGGLFLRDERLRALLPLRQ
jgi:DoxX-like protein